MSNLFSKLQIGSLEIKNRIAMPPMCMYSATEGRASDFHIHHYAARAIGGTGLIIVEATGVVPEGRITDNCLGAYDDAQVEGLSHIARVIKCYGSAAAIQLGHAGRKCEATVPEIYAPSPILYDSIYKTPVQMTQGHIDVTVEAFKQAAARAAAAGFDMIEIHGAHGYLLASFLSPITNTRTDEYGGSYENRVRFLGRVIDAVKQSFHGPICVRISASDYIEGGNVPEDLAAMINIVKEKGIDILNVSSGGTTPARPSAYPGYQLTFAETIAKLTGLPVIAGGMLTSPVHMEEIITNKRADMVYVGRELLRNPNFPLHASTALNANMPWPRQYERAKP